MANPIEKARDIIAKGEMAGVREWTYDEGADDVMDAGDMPVCAEVAPDDGTYIAAANPDALLPLLRLLVECEDWIDGVCELIETSDFVPTGEPRLVEEAQGGRALLDKLRGES